MAGLRQRFGEPARSAHVAAGKGSHAVLVYVAPELDERWRRAVLQALPEPLLASGAEALDATRHDFRHKAAWLGRHFRGALVAFTVDTSGQVAGINVELIDMPLAASVLNLQPQEP